MILNPDDFFYFITLFTIAIFGGTYLFFSYFRNRLLILNVLLFYLCSIIIGAEYYLQQVDSFATANQIYTFHNLIVIIFGTCLWACIWFYIKPFQGFKREKIINSVYLYGFIIPFLLIGLYGFYHNIFYYLSPEKIEGYWQSTVNEEHPLTKLFLFVTMIMMNVIVIVLFLITIIRNKKDRFRLSLLLVFRIIAPVLHYTSVITVTEGKWIMPSIGLISLVEGSITTWFVSNYRLFNNNLEAATSDLLNSISDLAISTDTNLLITNANDQAKSLLAIQQGNSMTGLMANNSSLTIQQIDEKMRSLIQTKNKHLEIAIIDKKEKERIFEIKAALLKRSEQIEGYTFLMTDLSETRKKERELKSLHETKDRLFAIIGHDLRKPALAFRGISKKVNFLVKKQEFERLNKFGAHIEQLAFSMNNLLDNLLNWALQQRAILPYNPVKLNVKESVFEIYQLFHQIAADKEIDLEMHIKESCMVFFDKNSFHTIIRNLVDNAMKYTPVGGTIFISCQEQDNGVLLKVKDTGIGMDQAMLDTLFLLNKNKSREGTVGEQGTGLGMTLVRDLITLNKGKIKVQSQWNEGTTFELFLPQA